MTKLLKTISAIGLLLTIIPAFLVFGGHIAIEQHYTFMLIGTIIWFFSAPFWMLKKKA